MCRGIYVYINMYVYVYMVLHVIGRKGVTSLDAWSLVSV